MKWLFLVLVAVAILLYFAFGLRLGYVTLMPTYLFHAHGQNSYGFQAYETGEKVGVTGTCRVREGHATLRLLDPSGVQVAGQSCPKGVWALQLTGGGRPGFYKLLIDFDRYSGVMDLKETRGSLKP